MKRYNLADLYRYEGQKCFNLKTQLRHLLGVPGFQYTWCLRHAQHASNAVSFTFLASMVTIDDVSYRNTNSAFYSIGPGMKIAHWGTIVVNPGASIGRNFGIAHGCLIGNSQGRKQGFPTIGNNVSMGANSMVFGGGCPRTECPPSEILQSVSLI